MDLKKLKTKNSFELLHREIEQRCLIVDGAMGTQIICRNPDPADYGATPGCHEILNINRPDIIAGVHAAYLEAGCDIIETNSFGANSVTLEDHGLAHRTFELNLQAARIAARTAAKYSTPQKPRFVSGSMGPGSKLPSLLNIDFDTLEQGYFDQARGLIEGGADLFHIETCQDILQIKTALHAVFRAQQHTGIRIPVIVQVTLEHNRMLLGSDILTALHTFVPFPLFGFGMNCGTGPKDMGPAIEQLQAHSPFYISVLPNAGMPRMVDHQPVYDLSPEDFAAQMSTYARTRDVRILGGCCGTTPEHIFALQKAVADITVTPRQVRPPATFTSLFQTQTAAVEPGPLIIGERTNANGSKKFREALKARDYDAMVDMALKQQKEGAHMLDLSVAYAGYDEKEDLSTMVKQLNQQLSIPLVFDSTDPEALEAGLKNYAGRGVINSINLEDGGEKAKVLIGLARRFGAALICLTIDEEGMARTREKKLAVARRIFDLATSGGMNPQDLFFDPLTFTLASGDPGLYSAGLETLHSIPLIKENLPGVHTILGVSNISYGIAARARKIINSVFLFKAVEFGLDAAIFHAGKVIPLHRISDRELTMAQDLIMNRRTPDYDPLEAIIEYYAGTESRNRDTEDTRTLSIEEQLAHAVLEGKKKGLENLIEAALNKYPALDIINLHLLPAMQQVGVLFGSGQMQLPFVLKSAETIKSAVKILTPHFDREQITYKGRVVLATVKGDVHDIGKNLVDIILSNNGYQVFNMGINQSSEDILAAAQKHRADYIGLSGLLVNSTVKMKETLEFLRSHDTDIPVICGGAALTRDYLNLALKPAYNGNVYYAADAFDALDIMQGGKPRKSGQNRTLVRPPRPVADRIISEPPLNPPFSGRVQTAVALETAMESVDQRLLFLHDWKEKDRKTAEQRFHDIYAELKKENISEFPCVYGYFPCRKEGSSLIVQNENREISLAFTTDTNLPFIPDYVNASGDFLPLLLVSVGEKIPLIIQSFFRKNEYSRYHYWHSFSVRMAETLAEIMHRRILHELGLPASRGKRFSPGYPAWPDLTEQKKIFFLLKPETVGVTLTENMQMVPEQSVSALVCAHSQAAY